MTDPTPELSLTDETYRERVIERFDVRRASFVKQFTLLIVFTLGFATFMLAPMIALKIESDELDVDLAAQNKALEKLEAEKRGAQAKLNELQSERDLLNGRLTSLNFELFNMQTEAEAKHGDLERLRQQLLEIAVRRAEDQRQIATLEATSIRSSDTLDRFDAQSRTATFREWFADMANRGERDPSCAMSDRRAYYRCMVRERLRQDWDHDFEALETAVVAPLRETDDRAASAIHASFAQVRERFVANLEGNPDFWQTIDQKLGFMIQLNAEMEHAFDGIRTILNESMTGVRVRLGVLEAELSTTVADEKALARQLEVDEGALKGIKAELEAGFAEVDKLAQAEITADQRLQATEQALAARRETFELERDTIGARKEAIKASQSEIADRFDKFQSPFGELPLGLREATLAFPFLVAAGFTICAFLLGDLLRLRCEYHRLLSSDSSPASSVLSHRVRVVAPLWLDPTFPGWQGATVAVLLLAPVAIYAMVVAFVSSGWLLPLDANGSDRHLWTFYETLYALGALSIAAGIVHVSVVWASYRKMLAPQSTVDPPGTCAQDEQAQTV